MFFDNLQNGILREVGEDFGELSRAGGEGCKMRPLTLPSPPQGRGWLGWRMSANGGEFVRYCPHFPIKLRGEDAN